MRLHEDKTLFRQAVQYTADQLSIAAIYVEKDYWVTYVLKTIFSHEIGQDTVFKGGTSLSKCFKMIDRFSEDIDLVVLRREGEANNRLTNKIRTISEIVGMILPEVYIKGVTHKMGLNRKTAHTYRKEFEGEYGQIRDVIVLESTWLGYFEPFRVVKLSSYVGEMMVRTNQEKLAQENEMLSFEVRVLDPVRTLCEKIMSLVRFSYGEDPLADLKKKIRHIYDLHQLLQQQEFLQFFHSGSFDEMILKVAHDDVISFKNNNEWLVHHPKDAFIFHELDRVWNELAQVYKGEFKYLVYSELPNDSDVLETLRMIKGRLVSIEWTIKATNQE